MNFSKNHFKISHGCSVDLGYKGLTRGDASNWGVLNITLTPSFSETVTANCTFICDKKVHFYPQCTPESSRFLIIYDDSNSAPHYSLPMTYKLTFVSQPPNPYVEVSNRDKLPVPLMRKLAGRPFRIRRTAVLTHLQTKLRLYLP